MFYLIFNDFLFFKKIILLFVIVFTNIPWFNFLLKFKQIKYKIGTRTWCKFDSFYNCCCCTRPKADLKKKDNLLKTIDLEISLKKDQIKRYELALEKDAYSFVQLSQRKDELLKLQKQKIINEGDRKNIEIDLFNSKLRSPIDGFNRGLRIRYK